MVRRKLAFFSGHPNPKTCRGTTMVVYGLVDPRDGEVKYIGITNNLFARFKEHLGMYGGNARKQAWLQDVLDANLLPYMVTLEVVEKGIEPRERESCWIQAYKDAGRELLNDEVARNTDELLAIEDGNPPNDAA